MADSIDETSNRVNEDISFLRQEITRLQKMISSQGAEAYSELRDKAGKSLDQLTPKAKSAADQVKKGSLAAADAAREHPTAVSTALLVAGSVGFLLGYLVGSQSEPQRPWWQR